MKRAFTLLVFLAISISFVVAQNFNIQTADTTFYGTATQSDFYGQIDLVNNTSSPLFMRWVRTEEVLPSSWESTVCTPSTCYPPTTDSSDYAMPVNNSNNYINVHFYPNNQEGIGYIKIKVFETNNPSQSYTMKFNGSTYPVGTQEQSVKLLNFYPNPTTNRVIVSGVSQELAGTAVVVYDFIGKEIKQEKLTVGQTIIYLTDLPSGNYLLKVQTSEYEIVKKIVKK